MESDDVNNKICEYLTEYYKTCRHNNYSSLILLTREEITMVNRNVCTTIYNGGNQYRVCLKQANNCTVLYQRAMQRAKRRHPRMSNVLIQRRVLANLTRSGHALRI